MLGEPMYGRRSDGRFRGYRAVHSRRRAVEHRHRIPEYFRALSFLDRLDVVATFVTLTYKGILPDYLQDSLIRLFTGAALGMALGIPAWRSDRHQPVGAPHLLAGPAVFPGYWRHRLVPIFLIWFGFGLTTMTFVIVYTVLFPVVLNTVLGVEFGAIAIWRVPRAVSARRPRACFGK